ncbi:MAG: hypothetical protein WBP29_00280 [Candidatus Zixiibacteriota bacterium]
MAGRFAIIFIAFLTFINSSKTWATEAEASDSMRSSAETDIFECVLWIGSQFPPDTCFDQLTGRNKAPFRCPSPPESSFRYFEEVLNLCLDANREDLARRVDFRLLPTRDTSEIYVDLVGAACRAGDRARATALLDTAMQYCESNGFCRTQYCTTHFDDMLDTYGFLFTSERQLDLLSRYAACVDTTEAKGMWFPYGFLAHHYFRLGELTKAESYAARAAHHWLPSGLYELTAFYRQYRANGDSIAAKRILDMALSLVDYVPGGHGYLEEEFLIEALRENGRTDESDRLFDDLEARELATLDTLWHIGISTANFEKYVRFQKLERGEFVLDSLSAGIADGSIDLQKSIEVVRGYCSLKLYSGAERLLQSLARTPIASKCALAAIQWSNDDPSYFQQSRFIQYIADIPTRDAAWLSMINPDEGDYGLQLAAERCRNIVNDEIRLEAITKLAPDLWMGTHSIDLEAEANELCWRLGDQWRVHSWLIAMFKGSDSYYEMAKARFYLTKREEFLSEPQNGKEFEVFPEYLLGLAEDYASCGLLDDAKRLIADRVLPQCDDDGLRARIAMAYGNMGLISQALGVAAEIIDPYDRGIAVANVACLTRNTSVKTDHEIAGYLHQIILLTERDFKSK